MNVTPKRRTPTKAAYLPGPIIHPYQHQRHSPYLMQRKPGTTIVPIPIKGMPGMPSVYHPGMVGPRPRISMFPHHVMPLPFRFPPQPRGMSPYPHPAPPTHINWDMPGSPRGVAPSLHRKKPIILHGGQPAVTTESVDSDVKMEAQQTEGTGMLNECII